MGPFYAWGHSGPHSHALSLSSSSLLLLWTSACGGSQWRIGPAFFKCFLFFFYLAVSQNPSNAQRKSRRKTLLHETADRRALLINTYSADAYIYVIWSDMPTPLEKTRDSVYLSPDKTLTSFVTAGNGSKQKISLRKYTLITEDLPVDFLLHRSVVDRHAIHASCSRQVSLNVVIHALFSA